MELKEVASAEANEIKRLTLSNLPAGTYAIFGKASVNVSEGGVKQAVGRCELIAEEDQDVTFGDIIPGTELEEWAPIPTELTHTFPSTGQVTLQCFVRSYKWYFGSNPRTRIVAIRIDSQHKTRVNAG